MVFQLLKRSLRLYMTLVLLFGVQGALFAQGADVAITVVPSGPSLMTGTYGYMEVTIENAGTVAATNVVVTDHYPVSLSAGTINHISGPAATSVYYAGATGNVAFASLAPGAVSVFRFYAKPKCWYSNGTPVANNFSATADTDVNPANDAAVANITIANTPPVFTTFPADITVFTGPAATACNTAVPDLGTYSATDNCGTPIVTITGVPAGNMFPVGTTVVTYTATDGGDPTVQTQNVNVVDNTPPVPDVASLPDVTISLGMPVPAIPTATDNCVGALNGTTLDPLSYATPGTFVVTWTYDDGNGNTATQNQNIIVTVPDVAISVTASTPSLTTGAYGYFEVRIENAGTEAATNVVVSDYYPVELSAGTINHISGPAATSVYYAGTTGNAAFATLAPGAVSIYRFYAKPKCYIADATIVNNNFTATADVDFDPLNNAATGTITIDNPAPVFTTFPADINLPTGPASTACSSLIPDLGAYAATDNCGTPAVTVTGVPAGNIFPVGTTVVTYTATDGAEQTIQTQNVTVTDNTPPVPDLAVLPAITVRYGTPVTTFPLATDNCAGTVSGTTSDPLTYTDPGNYTVTWTYDDGNGNVATQLQVIEVIAPDIEITVTPSSPSLTTGTYGYFEVTIKNIGTETSTNVKITDQYPVELSAGAISYISGQTATSTYYAGATGNIEFASLAPGAISVYRFLAKPKCYIADATIVNNNFSAIADVEYDALNNTAIGTVTIANPAPVFTTFPADINVSTGPASTVCNSVVPDLGTYTVTDNCGTPSVTVTGVPAGNIFPVGTTVVTYTATDGAEQTIQTQNVTVTDNTPPVADLAVLPDVTVRFNTPVTAAPTATDNCAGTIIGTTTDPLIYAAMGTYTITWTYDDGNGNISTQDQTVIVIAPDISITAVVTSPTTTTGSYVYTEVTVENVGSETATNVVVTNLIPPQLAPGGPFSHISGQTATSTGYSGSNGYITFASMSPGATSVYRFISKLYCSVGHEVVFSNNIEATADIDYDNTNNTTSVSITADNPAPVFATFPVDISVTTGAGAPTCDALVADLGAYTVTDNCTGSTVAITGVPAGNIFPVGTTVVTYTATDAGARQTVMTQNVTVTDDTPPVPDMPVLADFTDECSYTVTTAPTATDNCTGTLTATTTQPLPWTFNTQGTHSITWTYDDGNGNTTTQDQLVIIDDITAPVPDIASLPDLMAECGYTITVPPTATDNCNGSITGTTTDPLSYTTQGTFTVTWTYDDGNGNTTTQDQLVIIDDITAPVPDIATLPDVTGECGATVVTTPTATDNCIGQINGTTTDPLTYNAQGTYTVTWTYDDGNGNAMTQNQTVIVDDVTKPVPDIATLPDVTGECSATITAVPTATDVCVGSVIGTTTDPLTYTAQGTFYVTWSYDDGNGNIETQVQTVIVDDVTPPVVICAAGTSVEGDANNQAQVPDFTAGSSATDNCSLSQNLVWSQSPIAGTYADAGVNTITVYATDEAGNPGSCTTTFEVVPRPFIVTNPDYARVAFGCSSPLSFTRSVTITNGGGRFNAGLMAWTAWTNATPITITNASGIEGEDMLFTVNPAGLAPGNYTYYITISALNSATRSPATNSPYQFPVYVTVEPAYGGTISQTQTVGTSWTQFTNAYGQVFAEVKSNAGTISSFTVTAHPCSYPPAYPRVNFVNRYFNFSAAGSVNVDVRTYFTDTEQKPRVVQPENLILYQQPLGNGAWFLRGGTSNVTENYVELTGVTSLGGNWLPAHAWVSWFPKSLAMNVTGTMFDIETRSISIDWRSMISTNAEGFTVERCFGADPESGTWYEAGLIGFNAHGDYTFAEPVADLGLYHYRISTWDDEGNYFSSPIITIEAADVPGDYTLAQNYPNPFNPETVISYTIPSQETVSLRVYDMFWKEVKTLVDGVQPAGTHEVRFDGSRLPSGTYFYQMKAGSTTLTRKMNLTK